MAKNLKTRIAEEDRQKRLLAFQKSVRRILQNASKRPRPYADVPLNVKCDCGHTRKDHYQDTGWCHSSGHPKEGQCGCTFYHPNHKWIKMNNKRKGLPPPKPF